jgi:hypothetical protein
MFVVLALIGAASCQRTAPRASELLAGDVATDGSVVPCASFATNATECGEMLYHSRQLGKVKLGMRSQDVIRIMHVPTVERGGSSDGQFCYSVVLGKSELRCIELKNDRAVAFSDHTREEMFR